MIGVGVSGRRLAISLLVAVSAAAAGQGGYALPALQKSARLVQLRCKIVSVPADRGHRFWRVELRTSRGELADHAVGGSGGSLRFGNIQPGIYTLCISGGQGRERCESVDLTPAHDGSGASFEKELQAPELSISRRDAHQVNLAALLVPREARMELNHAEEAHLGHNYAQARQHLERALEICPEYPEALNNLGIQYRREGQVDRAIECFSKATEINSEFYAGWVNLGNSLMTEGKYRQALEASERALNLRPDNALANSQVALVYYYMHDYDAARMGFEKALALDPVAATSPQLYLAHIAAAQNRIPDAVRYFRDFLERHPNSPEGPRLRNTLRSLDSMSSTPAAGNLESRLAH